MRILFVEDDLSFWGELELSLKTIDGLIWSVAHSRDSAITMLKADFFDLIVLDLNLPSTDGAMDVAVTHGMAVFAETTRSLPGTPVILLTGSSAEPIYETILKSKEKIEVYGDNSPVDSIQLFPKSKALAFLEEIRKIGSTVNRTDEIELSKSGVPLELSPEESRVIRVMGRRFNGTGIRLVPVRSGLSSARVLRGTVVDDQGREILWGIVKLSDVNTVDDEMFRYQRLHALRPGDFAPLITHVTHGTRGVAGTLYRLAEGFDRSFFELLADSSVDAAQVVPRIQSTIEPWFKAAQVQRTNVGQVRARYLPDGVAAEVARTYSLEGLEALERKPLSVRISATHGDLHGANVLLGSDNKPSLIDFGDVGEACSVVDPLTLELSLFSHPLGDGCRKGWFPDFSVPWDSIADYAASSPISEFLNETRKWTHAVACGDQDVFANGYGYCLKQLKYPDTNKEFFVSAVREMKRCLERGH